MNTLFDYAESQRRKSEGMEIAADHNKSDLEIGRMVARRLGVEQGYAHAEQVGKILARDYGIVSLGNSAGSLFRNRDWTFSGDWHRSTRKTSHARDIKVWKFNGG